MEEKPLEHLEGTVEDVVYHNEDTGFTVLDVAVEEIFINIAHYAYQPGQNGTATVRCCVGGDPLQVTIQFLDSGTPFAPLAREDADTTLSAEDRGIGGLGILMKMDEALVVPDPTLSLREGAVSVSGWQSGTENSIAGMYFGAMAEHYGFSLDTPFRDLPEQARHAILYGTGNDRLHIAYQREFGAGTFDAPFEGIIPNLERRYKETQSDGVKQELESYLADLNAQYEDLTNSISELSIQAAEKEDELNKVKKYLKDPEK